MAIESRMQRKAGPVEPLYLLTLLALIAIGMGAVAPAAQDSDTGDVGHRDTASPDPDESSDDTADDTPASAPDPADLARWVTELGSPEWADRDRATRRLLAAGAAAVPLLREQVASSHPELRSRAQWLLRILDPLRGHVVVLRLGVQPFGGAADPDGGLREWAVATVVEGESVSTTTRNLDGTGTRVELSVTREGEEVEVVALLVTGQNPSRTYASLRPGQSRLLFEEERVEFERVEGAVERRIRTTAWPTSSAASPGLSSSRKRAIAFSLRPRT